MPEEQKKLKQGEVKEFTKKATDEKEKDFKASGVEGTKDAEKEKEKEKEKTEIVRGEDVVKILRNKGVKI